jgi:serine/threonine-protein kinase HipA
MARYASYQDLAEIVRHRFTDASVTLREFFARIAFNILCGNTDDHARNHAAFWDGDRLPLIPAYDICPQGRSGQEATPAMLISGQNRMSRSPRGKETVDPTLPGHATASLPQITHSF